MQRSLSFRIDSKASVLSVIYTGNNQLTMQHHSGIWLQLLRMLAMESQGQIINMVLNIFNSDSSDLVYNAKTNVLPSRVPSAIFNMYGEVEACSFTLTHNTYHYTLAFGYDPDNFQLCSDLNCQWNGTHSKSVCAKSLKHSNSTTHTHNIWICISPQVLCLPAMITIHKSNS
jgi:hypothetical protein